MTGTLMFMSVHLVLVIMVVVVGVRVPWVVLLIVPGVVRVVPARSVMFMSVHLVLVLVVVVVGVSVPCVVLFVVPGVVRVMCGVRGTMVVSVTMFVRVVRVFMPVVVMIVPVVVMIVGVMPMIVGVVFVIERFAQLHVSLLVTPDDGRNQDHPHQQQLPDLDSLLEHSLPPLL